MAGGEGGREVRDGRGGGRRVELAGGVRRDRHTDRQYEASGARQRRVTGGDGR